MTDGNRKDVGVMRKEKRALGREGGELYSWDMKGGMASGWILWYVCKRCIGRGREGDGCLEVVMLLLDADSSKGVEDRKVIYQSYLIPGTSTISHKRCYCNTCARHTDLM